MKRNLATFFLGGIPIGIMTGAWYSSRYGLETGLISGLFSGLFAGFIMFIILGVLHGRAVKKVSGEDSGEARRVRHERAVLLSLPYDKAFDLCIESLNELNRYRILQSDRAKGEIIARTSINWKTWGDTVFFKLERPDNGEVQVKVSSRPTARTTLVDYGKNLDNVLRIVAFLEGHRPGQ